MLVECVRPMSKSSSNCLVDYVNPKFHQYNKPLLLAVVVGGMTLGFVGVLTWMHAFREENCLVTTKPVAGGDNVLYMLGGDVVGGTIEQLSEEGNTEVKWVKTREPNVPGCIVSIQVAAVSDLAPSEPFKFQCKSLFDNSHEELGAFFNSLINPHLCSDSDQMKLAPPVDDTWPDFCPSRPPEYASWKTGLPPPIAFCFDRATDCQANYRFVIESVHFKVCPDGFVTLGAMLGYAGLIELAVTVAILLPLVACGCVQSGKNSAQVQNMKGWLKELASEREQGEELAEQFS